MSRIKQAVLAAAVSVALAPIAAGAGGDHHQKQGEKKAETKAETADTAMADGEVRKVDKDAKKITLKHGEIKSLDMPAMTMVFQVKEDKLLDKVKAGDKVKFKADKAGSGYAVTAIEVVK
ncbi:MAG: copper-binding protein [Betaproteobacteria bacterium]|nr:copper-binding protein [Betaproteobacteria bacterium]